MALDGILLKHISAEIKDFALGSRVEKIHQPNKDELIIGLRSRNGAKKLLISARANGPRVNFTDFAPENPKTPPMLCMLLRKKLNNAKLINIRQPQLERLLFIDFESINELGDLENLTLAVELMGKYSNVILVGSDGRIIDSLKRVDMSMSSKRLVLPGIEYQLPPPQEKLNIENSSNDEIINRIKFLPGEKYLNKAVLEVLQGVSPIVCREIEYLISGGNTLTTRELDERYEEKLSYHLNKLRNITDNASGTPFMICRENGNPLDITFWEINQYGSSAEIKSFDSFSELLDSFYYERDKSERIRSKSQDLLKLISNASDRLARKIIIQKDELSKCAGREHLRICGDLIQANLFKIEKGSLYADLENFYSETGETLRVSLDPALTPAQNSQKYYKEYRKAKTAEQVLAQQIEKAQTELEYMDTVFDSLSRAETDTDLSEIKLELIESGYLKHQKGKQKPPKALPPYEYVSSEGFRILVGRNNRQNDKLTLKQADKTDLWFHTKNIPGSHTIVVTENRTVGEQTINEAAELAAYHSKARQSSQVPVDFTQVKNVSKPQGAKPGMVIYVKNKTVYVTPKCEIENQQNRIK